MSSRLPLALLTQTVLVLLALALLALWPPQRGPILLVPIGGTLAGTINIAAAAHAALLAQGPLPGSMVVVGDRALLRAAIGDQAMLLLAAPPAWCGGLTEGGETA